MERTVRNQLRSRPNSSSNASNIRVAELMGSLSGLSPEARHLVRRIAGARIHLTRDQYRAIMKAPLAEALRELRRSGIIVALSGHSDTGDDIPVYDFPPNHIQERVGALLALQEPSPRHVRDAVDSLLRDIGYPIPNDEP